MSALLTPTAGLILEPDSSPLTSTLGNAPAMIDTDVQTTVSSYCDGPDSWGVNLGNKKRIDKVNVYFKGYGTPASWYSDQTDDFHIYSSPDGNNWTLQESFAGPSFTVTTAPYFVVPLTLTNPFYAQYVKVKAGAAGIATNPGSANSYITELTVEGEGTQMPANYLCFRTRDRIRKKGVSLGKVVETDRTYNFLIARHNRFRVEGVSKEKAVTAYGRYRYFRLFITNHTNTEPYIAEIEMMSSVGGADFCNGGTASASQIYSATYAASKAFDDNTATFWDGYPSSFPYPTYAGAWIKYDLGAGVTNIVAKYSIQIGATAYPSAWILQGSNDDSNWTDLDTRTGQTFTSRQKRTFTIGA